MQHKRVELGLGGHQCVPRRRVDRRHRRVHAHLDRSGRRRGGGDVDALSVATTGSRWSRWDEEDPPPELPEDLADDLAGGGVPGGLGLDLTDPMDPMDLADPSDAYPVNSAELSEELLPPVLARRRRRQRRATDTLGAGGVPPVPPRAGAVLLRFDDA